MTNTNTMEIGEAEYDVNVLAAVCWMCGKHEWHDRAGYAFAVSECRKCSKPVCENDAETDYDLVGDPGSYVCTQWQCKEGCLMTNTIQIETDEETQECEAGECDRQSMPNDSMCGLCGFIRDDARRTFFGAVKAGYGL